MIHRFVYPLCTSFSVLVIAQLTFPSFLYKLNATANLGQSKMFSFKLQLNDDTRRVKYEHSLTLESLKDTVLQMFSLSTCLGSHFKFHYEDLDGDKITIACDADINEFVSASQQSEGKVNKIHITMHENSMHSIDLTGAGSSSSSCQGNGLSSLLV